MNFSKALHSFMGYLEGTDKASHTIKNYRLDLLSFHDYLVESRKIEDPKDLNLEDLTRDDLEHYHQFLRGEGLKTNTRRRKLLTVQRFLNYLTQRNKLSEDLPRKLPTPHKVERVPSTVVVEELIEKIRALPTETELDERNRVLLWTLAETGCLVSEICQIRKEDWGAGADSPGAGGQVQIAGKAPRTIPVSKDLVEAAARLQARRPAHAWLFLGFNRHGCLGGPISPRGVEMLVRHYAGQLSYPELTPRMLRHSRVLGWHKQGVSREEMQRRLGLKTPYAFRTFEPLFQSLKSKSETTSSG